MVFLQRRFAILIVLLQLLIGYCHGYFNAPNLQNTLPFQSMIASAQRNSSLLLFGGENATNSYTNEFFQLTQIENGFSWTTLPQTNPPPPTSMGKAVYVDGSDALLLIGGMSSGTANLLGPIQIYLHDFASTNWQPWGGNNATNATGIPANRIEFSVSLDNQSSRIYVYGGGVNSTIAFNDLWVLDMATMAFAQLPSSDVARYGHSTSLLRFINNLFIFSGRNLPRFFV